MTYVIDDTGTVSVGMTEVKKFPLALILGLGAAVVLTGIAVMKKK